MSDEYDEWSDDEEAYASDAQDTSLIQLMLAATGVTLSAYTHFMTAMVINHDLAPILCGTIAGGFVQSGSMLCFGKKGGGCLPMVMCLTLGAGASAYTASRFDENKTDALKDKETTTIQYQAPTRTAKSAVPFFS